MLVIYETTNNELAYLNAELSEPTDEILEELKSLYGLQANFSHFTQAITMEEVRQGSPSVRLVNGQVALFVATNVTQPTLPSVEERVTSLEDAVTVLMGL